MMTLINSCLSSTTVALSLFAITVLALMLIFRKRTPHGRKRLPPGPWGLPVVGAAFRLGKEIYKDFVNLSKEYGQLFSLYIGSRLVVVLNGSEVIHDALVKNSNAFAGRPSLYTMDIASYGGRGIIHADYGKKWKILRKTSVYAIHNYLVNRNAIQSILAQKRDNLTNQLRPYTNQSRDILPELKSATANVILGILFGDTCNSQDFIQILNISDAFRETVGSGMAVDFMPWLSYFPNRRIDKLNELMMTLKGIICRLYHENRRTYTKGHIRNLADSLIEGIENLKNERAKESGQNDFNSNVEMDDLPTQHLDSIVTLSDLFGAGFDTTAITLYYAIAYLAAYPEVQKKMHEEIDKAIGRERKPEISDLTMLTYCKAFIYELMRITSLVPLSVPHSTTTDVTLHGYFIPEGTVVFVNLWSALRDPELWKDPDTFNPNRFLDDQGHVVHVNSLTHFLPFGSGRRACPGKVLAENEISFLLTSLLHEFQFSSHELQENKVIEVDIGLTLKPKNFDVVIRQR